MKKLLMSLILLLSSFAGLCKDGEGTLFYRIKLDTDIDNSAARRVTYGLQKAQEAEADYVLLEVDTYGGAVDAADSIRTALLNCDIPTVAYVNLQAVSAGALITIACDSIYMNEGSTIGAATVVNQNGEVMPEKYQSFMRAMMRSTAQAQGRNPFIAEHMVDSSRVVSLTVHEAIGTGFCEGRCRSIDEVVKKVLRSNPDKTYKIRSLEDDMTFLEKLIQFLMNPLLQSIFMMMIIGGIFVEIRTPGIGLPLLTAVLGAVLYFAPLYLEQLAASWEILLFVVGLILLALEIFVIPGFGVCGISGIIAVIVSMAFAMVDNSVLIESDGSFNLRPIIMPMSIVVISMTAAIFASILLVRKMFETRSFDHIALRQSLEASDGFVGVETGLEQLVGQEVTVLNDLKPSGKIVDSEGRAHEAVMAYGGFAVSGEKLKVIRTEQGRVYCEKI